MPVTDLTGTTWVFNKLVPPFPNKSEYYTESNIYGVTPSSEYGYFINYTWKYESSDRIYDCNYIFNYNFDGTEISVAAYPDGASHAFQGLMAITGGTDATNTDLINWLEANATQQTVSTKVSVDLTTLPGWEGLSDDTYNITIVAKADGYRDSEPSAAVSVEKAAGGYDVTLNVTQNVSYIFVIINDTIN